MDLPLYLSKRSPRVDYGPLSDDGIYKKMKPILTSDDKDNFVQVINRFSDPQQEYHFRVLCETMFSYDAAKCAAAILDGETQICDITVLVPCNPLLIYSVECGALRITALLLERGFSADVRSHSGFFLPNALPLAVALHYFRKRTCLFLPKKEGTCAIKFTIILFRSMIWSPLEMLRLLATKTRDIKHEFFNYLKEGKMVEVGALLLVARSRILSSSTGEGEFSSILEMRDFLSQEMTTYKNSKTLLGADDDKLIEMEQALLLLQIFDTIGDKLEVLFQKEPSCIGFVLKDAGFDAGFDVKDAGFDAGFDVKMYVAASVLKDAGFDVKEIPPSNLQIVCEGNEDLLEAGRLYMRKIAMAKDKPFSSSSGPQRGDYRAPNHTVDSKKP